MTEAEWRICTDPAPMLDLSVALGCARKLRLFGVACCRRAEVAGRGAFAPNGIDLAERLADGQDVGEDLTRFRSGLLYEGLSGGDGYWLKRAVMARWHLALAVFNTLQDCGRFRAGERRPVFEAILQEHHDDILHFALSDTLKQVGPGNDLVFDRPDICRPDLTRVWAEAARAVAYHLQPDDRPDFTLFQSLTQPDTRRRRDGWEAGLESAYRHEAVQQAVIARDIFGDPFRLVTVEQAWLTSTVVALAEGIYADRAFDRLPILADALQEAGCDNDDVLNHCRSEGTHVRGCWVVDLLTGRG